MHVGLMPPETDVTLSFSGVLRKGRVSRTSRAGLAGACSQVVSRKEEVVLISGGTTTSGVLGRGWESSTSSVDLAENLRGNSCTQHEVVEQLPLAASRDVWPG